MRKKENRKKLVRCLGLEYLTRENGQQCHYDLLFPGIRTFRYKKEPDHEDWGWRNKMKKENLLDYLDQAIEKTITDYDVALDWDTKNHTFEIIVRLFAENKAHFEIDDAEGVVSEEDVIEFEDGIFFIQSTKI